MIITVIRKQFANTWKVPEGTQKMLEMFGGGIFVVNDDSWRKQRKMASTIFTSRELANS